MAERGVGMVENKISARRVVLYLDEGNKNAWFHRRGVSGLNGSGAKNVLRGEKAHFERF